MISTATRIEDLTLGITEEIHVRAPLEATFAALLEQLGPFNETAEDRPMPMKLEAWPGGDRPHVVSITPYAVRGTSWTAAEVVTGTSAGRAAAS